MMNRGAIAALFVLGACVTEEVPDFGTAEQAVVPCPKWGCGENSPQMDAWDFWELNENGLPNDQGIVLVGLRRFGVLHSVHVAGTRLVATHPNGTTYTGAQLVGSYFEVLVPGPPGAPNLYRIYIMAYHNDVDYWVGPGESPASDSYELNYMNPATMTGTRALCANPPNRYAEEGNGHMWEQTLEAFLFTGDRYSQDDMEVTDSTYASTQGWFNIGCAGSALAKLHLNRHTTAGSTSTRQTTWQQRQALLKMYVSDFCGNGSPYTVKGTPLHWQNYTQWVKLTGLESSVEGFWGPDGAYCIEDHRLSPTYDAALAGCGVQKCSVAQWNWPNWWRGAYIKSANP